MEGGVNQCWLGEVKVLCSQVKGDCNTTFNHHALVHFGVLLDFS